MRFRERSRFVLLAREPGLESSDRRVVTLLLRPATLGGLYTVLQSALERSPRRAPRISTSLSARCWQNQWFLTGTVSSLSETGCLFRSSEAMSPEPEVTLVFHLPSSETVSTRTRQMSRGRHNVAFAFDDLPHESRSSIGQYVMGRLSAWRKGRRVPALSLRCGSSPSWPAVPAAAPGF